jgi:hypothetical protein
MNAQRIVRRSRTPKIVGPLTMSTAGIGLSLLD